MGNGFSSGSFAASFYAELPHQLPRLGYERVRFNTYKAIWDRSEIEHFLYFRFWDFGLLFSTDFALRHREAEQFSISALRDFGGPVYALLRHRRRIDAKIRFSLGRVAGWNPRESIPVADLAPRDLAERVLSDVSGSALPLVQSVRRPSDFLRFLLKDEGPCRWIFNNGALRAAQIIYLAGTIGESPASARAMLKPLLGEIARHVRGVTPTEFLELSLARTTDGRP